MNLNQIETFPVTPPLEIPSQNIGPGQVDTNMVSGSYSNTTFGYADNFDSSYNFVLPFYIDQNVTAILQVYLNLLFQKYRAFSKGAASEATHTHSVTFPAHGHNINGTATENEGTGDTAHLHAIKIGNKDNRGSHDLGVLRLDDQQQNNQQGNPSCLLYVDANYGSGNYSWLSTNTTLTAHSHGISATATLSGGGSTETSTAGSTHTHALTFGIYEAASFPTNVGIKIDSVDRTTALGGPWNPTSGSPMVTDLNLTKYITTIGYHTLELSTSTSGRCIPLLWIKSQSKK